MRILWMAWLALGCMAMQAEASMFLRESAAESQEMEDESAPPAPDPEIAVDDIASEYAADCADCGEGDCCCDGCIPPLFSYHCGCPDGCWDGCGCPNEKLFGLVAKSDYCFNSFISPISNPLFFEDPRQLSEVRFIYAHHIIPGDVPVLQGGHANFYAMQARARLTDRVSLIATKDGYIDMDTPRRRRLRRLG